MRGVISPDPGSSKVEISSKNSPCKPPRKIAYNQWKDVHHPPKEFIMKTTSNSTRWLGLALAAGALAFASPTEAAKPVKPPPPPPAPSGPTYRIVPLGTLGGNSIACSINESGWIAGSAIGGAFVVVPESSPTGPVYFRDTSPADGFNDLMICLQGTVAGYPSNGAIGINDSGIIAGTSWIPDGTDSMLGSTLWMGDTTISVPDPLWSTGWYCLGFNNLGMVLGGSEKDLAFDTCVVVPEDSDLDGLPDTWFKDTNGDGRNDLSELIAPVYYARPEYYPYIPSYFDPMAMNDAGQVVLYGQGAIPGTRPKLVTPDYTDADGDGNPWYADVNGDGLNDLMVSLILSSQAYDINSLGQVVGVASDGRAARWDFVNGNQTITYLGALIGSVKRQQATAINDAGVVVGFSSLKTGSTEGFLYYKGTIYNLPDCLVNATGWSGLKPNDLNEQGLITGGGYFNGVYQAFVLIPVTQP
jgi:probable HAF family extracellular repeat protein